MAENLTALLRQELNQLEQRAQELERRKQAIVNVLQTYSNANAAGQSFKVLRMPEKAKEPLSTLDMAERVIEKHGPMKAEQVMEAIRQEFGIKPAHTLPQMLYIRARSRKRFQRASDGRFGLIEKKKARKAAA